MGKYIYLVRLVINKLGTYKSKTFLAFILFSLISCSISDSEVEPVSEMIYSDFKLFQLPSSTNDAMNSYIITTKNKKLIIIDGGYSSEAHYLFDLLKTRFGYHVHAWFISHPHKDHVGALTEILNNPKFKEIEIDSIFLSLPLSEDVIKYEMESIETFLQFKHALNMTQESYRELEVGEVIEIDSISFEILGIKNPEITVNYLNNSSVVMRVYDDEKSILFTGDLGVEGGNKILKRYGNKLASEYVQMSHHGSHGVNKNFYIAVNPSYCLWPTPHYVWENNLGKGYNSGPFTTLIVKEWMDSIGVLKHFVMADGLLEIF